MARPKLDLTKNAIISFRTYSTLRNAIEVYAQSDRRTLAQMTELLLREAVIARRRHAKQSTTDIENLP